MDVVHFVRAAGISVQVVESAREAPESVRSRLITTLLRQMCGHRRAVGYWTNGASITLDAPGCPELDGFELQAVAGRHIIEDVHLGYAAVATSCRDEGRVMIVGADDDQKKWVKCDPSYEWSSTTGSRYRLVAPFYKGPSTPRPHVRDTSEAVSTSKQASSPQTSGPTSALYDPLISWHARHLGNGLERHRTLRPPHQTGSVWPGCVVYFRGERS